MQWDGERSSRREGEQEVLSARSKKKTYQITRNHLFLPITLRSFSSVLTICVFFLSPTEVGEREGREDDFFVVANLYEITTKMNLKHHQQRIINSTRESARSFILAISSLSDEEKGKNCIEILHVAVRCVSRCGFIAILTAAVWVRVVFHNSTVDPRCSRLPSSSSPVLVSSYIFFFRSTWNERRATKLCWKFSLLCIIWWWLRTKEMEENGRE